MEAAASTACGMSRAGQHGDLHNINNECMFTSIKVSTSSQQTKTCATDDEGSQ